MTGNHDDLQFRVEVFDFLQSLKAVHTRHPYIEQHQVNCLFTKISDGFFCRVNTNRRKPFICKDAGQRVQDAFFVINDKYFMRHGCQFIRIEIYISGLRYLKNLFQFILNRS